MRTKLRALVSIAALSAAVCVSSVSFAQEPSPGAVMSQGGAQHDQWADRMREHAQAKARALRDILNIRPDQEGAFQVFLATLQPPERQDGMGMRDDQDRMERMTTPERLDRMAARMADKQAEFQRHADGVRRFYAVLSPEQRRALDALEDMMMGGDHHGMRGDHHGMGGDPMGDHHGRGDDHDD